MRSEKPVNHLKRVSVEDLVKRMVSAKTLVHSVEEVGFDT